MAEIVFRPTAEAEYQEALSCYHSRNDQVAANVESAVAFGLQEIAEHHCDGLGSTDDTVSTL